MADLKKLQDVVSIRRKKKAKPLPKVEIYSLLFFDGDEKQRSSTFSQIAQEINEKVSIKRGLMVRPGHYGEREFDHLQMRVIGEDDDQIQRYFDVLDLLPTICENLKVPYLTERSKNVY